MLRDEGLTYAFLDVYVCADFLYASSDFFESRTGSLEDYVSTLKE